MKLIVSSFAKLIVLALASWTTLGSQSSAAELKLSWQVVQPFRFFRYPSDQAVQEWAFQDVKRAGVSPDRLVSAIENKLNSVAWWREKPTGSDKSRREMLDDLRRLEQDKLHRPFVPFDPRLGWASALRSEVGTSPATGTCWEAKEKSHRGCVSDIGQMTGGKNNDYLMPKRHMVELRVLEKSASGWHPYKGSCDFVLASTPKAGVGFLPDPLARTAEHQRILDADCAKPVYLRTEYKTSYPVRVSTRNSEVALSAEVEVKDLLVVGIGDSFASAEGNPEVPASLDAKQGVSPYISASNNTNNPVVPGVIIPTRQKAADGRIAGGTAARWLDDQCHRSIYSAQARAAIALAFEGERHHAVTYVSFACSGAEITDGLFWPQDHRECELNSNTAGPRLYQPQLSAVVDALSGKGTNYVQFDMRLDAKDRYKTQAIDVVRREGWSALSRKNGTCQSWPNRLKIVNPPILKSGKLDRKIDLLFVSIGGNDIGFGPLVSKAVINSNFANVTIPYFSARAIRVYQAAAGAIRLQTAKDRVKGLDGRFALLERALRQSLKIDDPSRIVVSAYPQLSKRQTGFCTKGNNGMNVSTLFSTVETSGPNFVTAKDADQVVSELNGKISGIAGKYGWRIATAHVGRFAGHSFCDTDAAASGFKAQIEALDLPHKQRAASPAEWRPFNPATQFYPYESRMRWVRTFNDAYLLSNYFKGFATDQVPVNSDPGLYQAQRALGGPMHPTAEGHSHMADGLLIEARKAVLNNGLVQ